MCHFAVRRGVYGVMVWNPEGKRVLRRHGHIWKNNIEMDIKFDGEGWTG